MAAVRPTYKLFDPVRCSFLRLLAALAIIVPASALVACQPVDAGDDGDGERPALSASEGVARPTSVGEGTPQSPYTVGQVKGGVERTADVWVVGYLVGYMANNTINQAVFDAKGAVTANVLLASSPDEKDARRVLPVQLPDKNGVREGVSLAYHPEGLGRAVMLHAGVVADYCHALGLRDVDGWLWIDSPEGLDIGWGWPTEGGTGELGQAGDTDEPVQPDEPAEPDEPDEPAEGEWTVYDVHNVTAFLPVLGFNQNSGLDERYPCFPDYIFAHDLMSMYKESCCWIAGYPDEWASDHTSAVVASNADGRHGNRDFFVLDIDDLARPWIALTHTPDKMGYPMRIRAKLKYKNQRYHIVDIQTMEWIRKVP